MRGEQHTAALGEPRARPRQLREASPGDGVAHVVGARAGQLVQHLAGRRGEHGDGFGARRDDVVGEALEEGGGGDRVSHQHSLGQLTHFADE